MKSASLLFIVLALVTGAVSYAQAKQTILTCKGHTLYYEALVPTPDRKDWVNTLTIDFDAMTVFHGAEQTGPKITRKTDTSIQWHEEGGYETNGEFNRITLTGNETLHEKSSIYTIRNFYDACSLAKPRI
jgi:hypothetical protein